MVAATRRLCYDTHMMRLIFFDGIDHTLTQFTEELVKAAEIKEIPYLLLHVQEGKEAMIRKIGSFAQEGPCAAVIFNNIFLPLPGKDCSLWERLKIPVYNILMDHPRNYAKYLDKNLPTMQVLTVDRRHEDYIHSYYPLVKKTAFLPHGGTAPGDRALSGKPFSERSIDVLLLSGQLPEPEWLAIPFLADGGQRLYEETLTAMLTQPHLDTEQAAMMSAEKLGLSLTTPQWKEIFENDILSCEWEARRQFKEAIIRELSTAEIPVHLYGTRWDWAKDLPYMQVHDPIPVWDCFPLLSDAKIALNVMPWFKDGGHDRIFSGMLHGAVCVTDSNRYLKERYTSGNDIVFYELTELSRLPKQIRWLLDHPQEMEQIAKVGQEKAAREDTWANRLEALLTMMTEVPEE